MNGDKRINYFVTSDTPHTHTCYFSVCGEQIGHRTRKSLAFISSVSQLPVRVAVSWANSQKPGLSVKYEH